MSNLNAKAWLGLVFLALAMGLLLFLSAGTTYYWQAWAYLVVFVGAAALITLYLIKNDPALLERRLRAGPTAEKERSQKIIMLFASIGFISTLARISHTDLGSEEQSRQLHANIVRMEGCNLRESWQAQGRCGDGRGRVWPGAVSGSSVRRSAHELCVGEGEVALIGVTRSHREGNATHAGADEGAEL